MNYACRTREQPVEIDRKLKILLQESDLCIISLQKPPLSPGDTPHALPTLNPEFVISLMILT
jgi:hypothetical protein